MSVKKYYFEGTTLDTKYATLWNGYLSYNFVQEMHETHETHETHESHC